MVSETPSRQYLRILGMKVHATSYKEATKCVLQWARNGESRAVFESNVHMVMETRASRRYSDAIENADLVTPGGMPLVWMMRLSGFRKQPRVYGPSLMLQTCTEASAAGIAIGLYGSTPKVIADLRAALVRRFPSLRITYVHSPPFRSLTAQEDDEIVAAINASGCRILFVGLGCPRQEAWIAEHRSRLPCVMLAVGAAFDFISGHKAQAADFIQRMGFEWLFRFCTEPRRLWFRYAYHNPRFVVLAAVQLARSQGAGWLKRILDLLVAIGLLLALLPLMLVIGLAIKLTSQGPVFICQRRVGARGGEFRMWKFRTMKGSAQQHGSPSIGEDGILDKPKSNPRVTRVGKWLRRTSADELPQLLNVLIGDMSLVGPRPLPAAMLVGGPDLLALRASRRPGLTGLWQIRARHQNTSINDMLAHDLEYVQRWSLWLDFTILARTIPAVAFGKGAY